jgi:hypothetical protein
MYPACAVAIGLSFVEQDGRAGRRTLWKGSLWRASVGPRSAPCDLLGALLLDVRMFVATVGCVDSTCCQVETTAGVWKLQ